MSNDYLAVFLYRWDDETDVRDASTVSYGEKRSIKSHYPSTVIGVATRPKGQTVEHDSAPPEYEDQLWERWQEHVEELANDVRWFDDPLECAPDSDLVADGGVEREPCCRHTDARELDTVDGDRGSESTVGTEREGGCLGDGPDQCVVCGDDASHTLGRHCSSECAKREAGIPKRLGWQCELCEFSSTSDDAAGEVAEHLIEKHSEELTVSPEVVRSVGLASVHTLCSRVTAPREQQTLLTDGGRPIDTGSDRDA